MRDVADKVAFITGGASGIGLGMAQAFVGAGMRVVLADIDIAGAHKAAADLIAEGASAHAVALDVIDPAAWARAAAEAESAFGPVDVFCNNAGVGGTAKPVAEIPIEEWRWVTEIDYYGVVHGLQCFVPRLKAKGAGHIVNTASLGGVSPTKFLADYIAAKFAVVGLSGCLRAELEDQHIGVSALCAGSVRTNLGDNSVRQRPARARFAADRAAMIKDLKWRYIEPLDAGRIVLRGISENWPFIFTHPEDRALLETRHAAMMAAFDALGEDVT